MKTVLLATLFIVIASAAILAQQPESFDYEGNLLVDRDRPVHEGLHNITVFLFNNQGQIIWEERHERVPVHEGRFSIRFGTHNPLEVQVNQLYQIGLLVDDEEEPRRRTWNPHGGDRPIMETGGVEDRILQDRIPEMNIPPEQLTGEQYIRKNIADTSYATLNQPILVVANLGNGNGLVGRAEYGNGLAARSKHNHGVWGRTDATMSETAGVYGYSESGTGVTGRSDQYNGVKALTKSDEHAALAAGNEGKGVAIYAQGGTNGLAAIFSGNVQLRSQKTGATILELGEGLDYAEGFNMAGEISPKPGLVCSIDPAHPGRLMLSSKAYDKKVAGIVAGARGLGSGVRLGSGQSDIDVALAGRVYCYVEALEDDIKPGDLLTTSSRPGYAMATHDQDRARGAILGKAMEGLKKGTSGLILVLVTLQ